MRNLAAGHLFMLGRLAVPKTIHVRPVGSPENTSHIGENPNTNNPDVTPWTLTLTAPPVFCPKFIYGTFSALRIFRLQPL